MENSEFCCEQFPIFANRIKWIVTEDYNHVSTPAIEHAGKYIKIYFCPFCGNKISEILLSVEQINDIIKIYGENMDKIWTK